MTKVWLHIRLKLVDPEHKRPDRKKSIMITMARTIEEVEIELRIIEKLINEGYIIEDMVVVSG